MTVSFIAAPGTDPLLMHPPGLSSVHLTTRHAGVTGTHLWGYSYSNRNYSCKEMEIKFGGSLLQFSSENECNSLQYLSKPLEFRAHRTISLPVVLYGYKAGSPT